MAKSIRQIKEDLAKLEAKQARLREQVERYETEKRQAVGAAVLKMHEDGHLQGEVLSAVEKVLAEYAD